MGSKVLDDCLPEDSFLRSRNKRDRLVAVFPSTTPAALTTLATGAWPGQHGQPGWDLRDQKGCEYPGKPSPGVVQLRCLHPKFFDMRSHKPCCELGFSADDVFVQKPWTALGDS